MLTGDLEERDRKILELNDLLNKFKMDKKMRENEIDNVKKKNECLNEMLKNLQSKLVQMENALEANGKNWQKQEEEKNEMAEKLLQSIKIIMEEKSARQSIELMAVEKEKNYKEELMQLRV